jgi:hypothetical protein
MLRVLLDLFITGGYRASSLNEFVREFTIFGRDGLFAGRGGGEVEPGEGVDVAVVITVEVADGVGDVGLLLFNR